MLNSVEIEQELLEIQTSLEAGNYHAAQDAVLYLLESLATDEPDCDYELTENQQVFVKDAMLQELEISYSYSGRGMFGKQCPSVKINPDEGFSTAAVIETDSMGRGTVVYARH